MLRVQGMKWPELRRLQPSFRVFDTLCDFRPFPSLDLSFTGHPGRQNPLTPVVGFANVLWQLACVSVACGSMISFCLRTRLALSRLLDSAFDIHGLGNCQHILFMTKLAPPGC
jgi:hypothetical protein